MERGYIMKNKICLGFLAVFAVFVGIDADAKFVNYDQQRVMAAVQEAATMTVEDVRTIQTLENDLRILDAEIKKCESSKKGWTAATVIGSAGIAATGIAAIVQGVKISDKKSKLSEINKEKKGYEDDTKNLGE
jgi:hypothetical protein